MQSVRIFISSPGDVSEERERARQVIQGLRRRYAQHFDLVPVLWEDMPLSLGASFQEGIDVVLSVDRGIDIAVFILWSRLGSALGPLVRREDGRDYRSGTERELDLMLRAREANGGERPRILAYARLDEATFEESLRGKTTSEKEELLRQKRLVEQFIQETFHDPHTGANLRAYHTFHRPQTFGERLRVHLQEILDGMCEGRTAAPLWDIDTQGPPFRGLEPFRFEHAEIFFGREDEVLEARTRLAEAARRGTAFLLIGGASGTGKSSLAAAGLLPEIVNHEIDDAVARWIPVQCTPATLAGDPAGGIARLLCAAIPSIAEGGDAADFALALARDPELAVKLVLAPALRKLARPGAGAVRLMLFVDQLEELFTDARLTEAARTSLAGILHALASSGQAWVVATIRGDFYPRLLGCDPLVRLKSAGAQLDLLPPHADAIRRMIESPAALAGLRYETSGNASVADRILRDIAAQAELLPLLEDFLRELFDRRSPAGLLTIEAYEGLGGIVGSLANRAEAAFTSLPAEAQIALPLVLRQLVSMDESADGAAVRRRAPLAAFPAGTPARAVIDRLVADRLASADSDEAGGPDVMIAHEAILRVWPRAAAWIAQNGEFLRTRDRLTARMTEAAPISSDDPLLAAARLHLASQPDAFDEELRDYVRQQIARLETKRVRRDRRRRAAMAGLTGLALCSMAAAGVAAWQWRQTRVARDHANESRLQAEGLVDTIVMKLWDKLEQAGRLDLLGDSHGAVATYYERIAQDLPAASKEETERAINRIVTVRRKEFVLKKEAGDLDAAEASVRAGIQIVEDALRVYPSNVEFLLDRSSLVGDSADIATARGNYATARETFTSELKAVEALAGAKTVDQSLLSKMHKKLSFLHSRLGGLDAISGETELAKEHYAAALEHSAKWASLEPDDCDAQRYLMVDHMTLGDHAFNVGDLDAAREHCVDARRIAESLSRRDRRNVQWQADVAMIAGRFADLASRQGDTAGERTHRERAIAVLRPLADTDATDTDKHSMLVQHAARVGFLAQSQGDLAAARAFQDIALAAASTLLTRQPDNSQWQEAIASAHESLGRVAQSAGDLEVAKAELEAALASYRRLADGDADNPSHRLAKGMAASVLGDVMQARGDQDAARTHFQDALTAYESLPSEMKEDPECLDAMSVAHSRLGDIAAAAGDRDTAVLHRKQESACAERLSALDPDNLRWKRGLCLSVSRMGDLERDGGNREAASALYRRALDTALGLTKSQPNDVVFLDDVAYANEQLAQLSAESNDGDSALRHLQDAVAAREAIVRLQPLDSATALAWCQSMSSLADQLTNMGHQEVAQNTLEKSLHAAEQYASQYPAETVWRIEVAVAQGKLAHFDFEYGRLATARRRLDCFFQIASVLHSDDSGDIEGGRFVARLHQDIAFWYAVVSLDLAAARNHLDAAIDFNRSILKDSLNDQACSERLISAYCSMAYAAWLESDFKSVRESSDKGLQILKVMIAEDPANPSLRRDEALLHQNMGEVQVIEGKGREGMACYHKAMEILEPLEKDYPDDLAVRLQMAELETYRASAFLKQGDLPAAGSSADRAKALLPPASEPSGDFANLKQQLTVMSAHISRGDVAAARSDWEAAHQDYADALSPIAWYLQDGRTYPLFAWMAVEAHAGLQWLAEKQGDAFAAGQHKADLRLMARRAIAEAPQAAVTWMKKVDHATAGVLIHSRVAIGQEVGRQLREAGDAEAAATCEDYVTKWKKLAADASASADVPAEAAATSP